MSDKKDGDSPVMRAHHPALVTKPLLGLVMIVRDEVKRISEVLASYLGCIDSYTILDTGSVDGTQELIHRILEGA